MKVRGFTLPEMLIAMALSSVLLIGAARLLPILQQQQLSMFVRMQLQEELAHLAAMLTKHLQRAGYCHGHCKGTAFHFSAHCLTVRWDNNSNGHWEQGDSRTAERFAFRLRAGALESQRGGRDCDSSGWERITDPAQMTVTEFIVEQRAGGRFHMLLAAVSKRRPNDEIRLARWVTGINL